LTATDKANSAQEVVKRLGEISDHFAARDNYCSELPQNKDIIKLLANIHKEEIIIFTNLVALKDDAEQYFSVHGLSNKEIKMVTSFKPFQLASNSIKKEQEKNDNLHQRSYYSLVRNRSNALPVNMAPVIAHISFVKDDGNLFPSIDLILDLIRIWAMFLINHTEIDIREFEKKISTMSGRG